MLAFAVAENRIMLSEDRDFGELVFAKKRPAIGIVLAKVSEFGRDIDAISAHVAKVIDAYGDKLIGQMTVIEPGRERQTRLPGSS